MRRDPRGILVLRLGGIGEVLAITPALKAIRERFPKAYITILAERPAYEVASPFVDEAIVANAAYRAQRIMDLARGRFYGDCLRIIERVSRRPYDLFLDFHHFFGGRHIIKPLLVSLLSRARTRVGFQKGRGGFYLTSPVADPTSWHMGARPRMILSRLGIRASQWRPILRPSQSDRDWVRSRGLEPPLVAISPGASTEEKCWSVERFAQTARRLAETGRIVVTGAAQERALCDRVPGMNLAGETTLGELAALFERCSLVVSNDSGPAHIAHAVGTRVVALFLPRAYREWGRYEETDRFRALVCDDSNGTGLDRITVEEVVRVAGEMLHAPAARP